MAPMIFDSAREGASRPGVVTFLVLVALMGCESQTESAIDSFLGGEVSFDMSLLPESSVDREPVDAEPQRDTSVTADSERIHDVVEPMDAVEADALLGDIDAAADLDAGVVRPDQGEPWDSAVLGEMGVERAYDAAFDGASNDAEFPADLSVVDSSDMSAGPDVALARDVALGPDADPLPDSELIPDAALPEPDPVVCRGEVAAVPPCNGCPEGTEVPSGWACIPGGEFWMGREDSPGRHLVRVTRPFLIMQTEVTIAEWLAAELRGRNFVHPGINEPCEDCEFEMDVPVERVTWSETLGFANARSEAAGLRPCYELRGCSGLPGTNNFADGELDALIPFCREARVPEDGLAGCEGFRLPTEAEWELAARAGVDGPRYGPPDEIAWHVGNFGGRIHPVAQKAPNAFGLYDVLGNVREVVWDEYDPDYWGFGDAEVIEPQDVDPATRIFGRAVAKGSTVVGAVLDFGVRSTNSNDARGDLTGIRLARSIPSAPCGCPPAEAPVCGVNGVTYQSDCLVDCAAVQIAHEGECRQDCLDPEAIDVEYLSADPTVCGRIQTFRCPRGQAPFSNECGCGCGGAVLACRTDEHCVVPGASCLEGRCVYPDPCECPDVEAPVCGEDTATYRNECEARCAGVDVVAEGECVALDGCPDPDELAVVYFRRAPLGCDFMSYFCEEEEEKVPPECGCGCFVPPEIPCLETNDCPVAEVCRGGICEDEPERCDFDFECGRDSFCYDLRCVPL